METIPQMKFFTDANLDIFWADVKNLLFAAGPGVMISVAVICIGMLITIIVSLFRKAEEKENDDYDTKYY